MIHWLSINFIIPATSNPSNHPTDLAPVSPLLPSDLHMDHGGEKSLIALALATLALQSLDDCGTVIWVFRV